jgi:hypothetical protein
VKISYQVPEIIPLYGLGVASPFLVAAGWLLFAHLLLY